MFCRGEHSAKTSQRLLAIICVCDLRERPEPDTKCMSYNDRDDNLACIERRREAQSHGHREPGRGKENTHYAPEYQHWEEQKTPMSGKSHGS